MPAAMPCPPHHCEAQGLRHNRKVWEIAGCSASITTSTSIFIIAVASQINRVVANLGGISAVAVGMQPAPA